MEKGRKTPIVVPKMLMSRAKSKCAEKGLQDTNDMNDMVQGIHDNNVAELRCYLRAVCMRTA